MANLLFHNRSCRWLKWRLDNAYYWYHFSSCWHEYDFYLERNASLVQTPWNIGLMWWYAAKYACTASCYPKLWINIEMSLTYGKIQLLTIFCLFFLCFLHAQSMLILFLPKQTLYSNDLSELQCSSWAW